MHYNDQPKGVFQRFLEAAEKTGDITLRYLFQREMFLDEIYKDKYLDEIADRVIQRLNFSADTINAIQEISSLKQALIDLGVQF